MNCEDLFIEATKSTDKKTRATLLGEVYFANIGLTVDLIKEFCGSTNNRDDFMQLAYIALDKACRSYKIGEEFSPLSYYRMWLRHECYQCWLKSGCGKGFSIVPLNTDNHLSLKYNKVYKVTDSVERLFMNRLLWDRVHSVLNTENAQIVIDRYSSRKTLKSIGDEFGISAERVRQRLLSSYKKLKSDPQICEVAQYYHYQ